MKKIFYTVTLFLFTFVLTASLFASYNPEQGRWINRDPISEEGGANLYNFVKNNPITAWDYLGLVEIDGNKLDVVYDAQKNINEHYRGAAGLFVSNASASCACDDTCTLKCTMKYDPKAYVRAKDAKSDFIEAADHEVRHALVFSRVFLPRLIKTLENYEKTYKIKGECENAKGKAEKAFADMLSKLQKWERVAEYGKGYGRNQREPWINYPTPGNPDYHKGKNTSGDRLEHSKQDYDKMMVPYSP